MQRACCAGAPASRSSPWATLALGMGANTAIFSLIDAILLRMLPVQHPEELVELGRITQYGSGGGFSYPIFER